METVLQSLLIVVSTLLIIVVLMQSRGAGFGGAFGGAQGGSAYRTRRGLERYLFRGTVVLAAVFVAIALITARMHIPS